MEISEWATRILGATTLEEKLLVDNLTDHSPGPRVIWREPSRPPGMQFSKRKQNEKLPPFHEHANPDKRAICLHRFAGHELLAVEIMAYVLLAFPDAPPPFRKAVARQLQEEQEHVKLYIEAMNRLGLQFGDLPLYKHFWAHTPYLLTPLHYLSMMNLTFEMANLDFAPMYGKSFLRHGDSVSAALMGRILHDEIGHVKMGYQWLKKLKSPEKSEWETWIETLSTTLLTPKRAKGFLLHENPRKEAGLSDEWILALKEAGA